MAPSAVQPMFILWTMLWIIFQWQRCGVDTVDTVVGVENARLCRRRNLWFKLGIRFYFGFMYQWWGVDFVVVDVEEAWLRRRRSGAATKGGFLVRPVNHRRTALANWFLCPTALASSPLQDTQSDSLASSPTLVWFQSDPSVMFSLSFFVDAACEAILGAIFLQLSDTACLSPDSNSEHWFAPNNMKSLKLANMAKQGRLGTWGRSFMW